MIARFRIPALVLILALVAAACAEPETRSPAFSGDITAGNPDNALPGVPAASGAAPEPSELSALQSDLLDQALEASPEGCDVLDTRSCLLPFPSDALTVEDPTSGTLRRVDLPLGQLPNVDGVTLDPSAWNLNDGFSPNTPIVVFVPGIDPGRTNLPSETDIAMSLTPESATVLVDLDSGQLVPHWAEMDLRADSPDDRSLIIRPAVSLTETHRIAVGLRNVLDSDGLPIPTPVPFQVLRDNKITDSPELDERRADYDVVFNEMATAGVNRADLYLAWWFTVASADSLAGRVLSMREDAFGTLDGGAPRFAITDVRTDDLRDGVHSVVEGTYQVPLYLDDGGGPGSRMVFNSAGQPDSVGTYTARFVCTVPEEGKEKGESRPVVYGHGLLGSANEAASSHVQETVAVGNFVYCGTDAIGLSSEDVGFVAGVLSDMNLFPSVPDRLQQAILNYLFLGRLMVHMDGLGSTPEFTTTGGANMLNTFEAFWDGNSQGAILGGAVTAVATDWTKAVLGVGGMNYSTLLNRSVDFDEYFAILRNAYPNPLDQQLIYGVIQMLWDRGETGGYVQHLTNRPYDLTPPHEVLMIVAFGDHQVATITADNIARTLGIPLYQPVLPDGADDVPDEDRFFNLTPIRGFPHDGSALYYWYSGTLPPPNGNITPTMGPLWDEFCGTEAQQESDVACWDPHEDPRRQPGVIEQKDKFFTSEGTVVNVCDDEPCLATPREELDY